MNSKSIILILFAAVCIFTLRFYLLTGPALTGDEGDFYRVAKCVHSGGNIWECGAPQVPVYYFFLVLSTGVFGLSEFGIRILSAMFGLLVVFLVFVLAKKLFDFKTGLLSGALVGVIPFFVLYSRHGYTEMTQVLFVLLAIIFLECSSKKWCAIIGGICTGLAVGVKINSLAILGLYWIFRLYWNKINFRKEFIFALEINFIGFAVLLLTAIGGIKNFFYLGYGFFFWTVNQVVTANFPWYYGVSVILDGISPVLIIIIGFAVIKSLKVRSRNELLCAWLFVAYSLFVLSQARKYPRHLLLGVPFAVMLAANYISKLKSRQIRHFLICVVFLTAAGGSIYHISASLDTVVIKNVAGWASTNLQAGTKIIVPGIDFWPWIFYTGHNFNITTVQNLKKGDYAVNYYLKGRYFAASPLENDLFFWVPRYADAPQFNFSHFEGDVKYSLQYGEYGVINIVQLRNDFVSVKPRINLGAVKLICDVWIGKNAFSNFFREIVPDSLVATISKKCTKGCVDTCEMF